MRVIIKARNGMLLKRDAALNLNSRIHHQLGFFYIHGGGNCRVAFTKANGLYWRSVGTGGYPGRSSDLPFKQNERVVKQACKLLVRNKTFQDQIPMADAVKGALQNNENALIFRYIAAAYRELEGE